MSQIRSPMPGAKTAQQQPPHISLFTDHDKKSVEILVVGRNGNLSLSVPSSHTAIVICDPTRGPETCKAICEISANGHFKGYFVAKKGTTTREDTLVWFPARTPRKRPAKARKAA
jgi:hypothetical protein